MIAATVFTESADGTYTAHGSIDLAVRAMKEGAEQFLTKPVELPTLLLLLGATPRRQQTAELIGVLTSAVFVCLTVLALGKGFGFGSTELPAPQATLMKLVIDGVLDQNLPWALVAIGAGIAIVCEIARIPSLPFAVGVYLPVSTMTPIFVDGLIRLWMERKAKDEEQAADEDRYSAEYVQLSRRLRQAGFHQRRQDRVLHHGVIPSGPATALGIRGSDPRGQKPLLRQATHDHVDRRR